MAVPLPDMWSRGVPPLPRHPARKESGCASQIHPELLEERLGHTSIRTNLDVYGHLFDGLVEAAWLEPPTRGPETGGRPRADYGVRPAVFDALDRAAGGAA